MRFSGFSARYCSSSASSIGDRCSECGKALDVRSVRPAWAVGDGPARLQRAADLGLLGNLMLVVGFLVALLLLVFKATSIIIPFALVAAVSACGASGVAGGSLLLIPLACGLFGISNDIAMQVVAVGFIIGVIQDSAETALNSSTDVIFTAAVCESEAQKAQR